MTDQRKLLSQLVELARRNHYTCEDSWYSCPRSEDGSANDNAGKECDCGADEHNAKVDAICAALAQPEPEELTKDRRGEYSGPSMTNCIIDGNPPNGYVTWIEWYNELGSKGILHNLRISSIEAEKLKEKERRHKEYEKLKKEFGDTP